MTVEPVVLLSTLEHHLCCPRQYALDGRWDRNEAQRGFHQHLSAGRTDTKVRLSPDYGSLPQARQILRPRIGTILDNCTVVWIPSQALISDSDGVAGVSAPALVARWTRECSRMLTIWAHCRASARPSLREQVPAAVPGPGVGALSGFVPRPSLRGDGRSHRPVHGNVALPGSVPDRIVRTLTAGTTWSRSQALPGFAPGPRCAIIARGPLTMDGQDVGRVGPGSRCAPNEVAWVRHPAFRPLPGFVPGPRCAQMKHVEPVGAVTSVARFGPGSRCAVDPDPRSARSTKTLLGSVPTLVARSATGRTTAWRTPGVAGVPARPSLRVGRSAFHRIREDGVAGSSPALVVRSRSCTAFPR
jgi:hypothetical protein